MSEPHIIARIEKNRLEEVVIAVDHFRGVDLIDIRIHADFSGADKERRPTKKGIALKIEKLPDLIAALNAAADEARRRGLLKDTGGGQ
jgi:hypothetical protein